MKSTERVKTWRLNNPERAAFLTLRYNAKRRGVPFEISFEYFKAFAFKTKLLTSRGRNADSLTVDRIDSDIGYIEGNLAVLSLSDNGFKGYLEREIYYVEGSGLRSKVHKPDNHDYPF